ncbi:MAG: DUF3299 domain-containing protein [Candidatus Sumerlaeia bacterium]|nr:DUF3299 domain-containing protein [Candidatus Sumerlaeia bacterium]
MVPAKPPLAPGALLVRGLMVAATVWMLAALLLPNAPMASQVRAQTNHLEVVRSDDELTSAALALQKRLAEPRKDGEIDFLLLRATTLRRQPPPVYPEALAKLDGTKVRVVGFMAPYDRLDDMSNFMLMTTPVGCTFCEPPSPKEVVFVRQHKKDPAEKLPFVSDPIEIEGTLNLWKADSEDLAHEMFLYVVNDTKVTPIRATDFVARTTQNPERE